MTKIWTWQTENAVKDSGISCKYLTYVPQEKYTWDMNFVSVANAQDVSNLATVDNLFSVPLYIVVFFFLAFTVTMSLVYLYHWVKYNLNDPFIKNFSIIYFTGLCLLLVPLIFNLLT
jgi:hypothetical protein